MVNILENTGSFKVHSERGKNSVSVLGIRKAAFQVEKNKASNVLQYPLCFRSNQYSAFNCAKQHADILRYYSYKRKLVQKLLPNDFETRRRFSLKFLARLEIDLE